VFDFHYDRGGHQLAENIGTFGSFLREYVWLDDLPVGFVSNGVLDYIHTDHLGTPQKMTNSSQTIVWDGAASDPFMFGQLPTNLSMNLRFPGQYFDQETGLHYNGMRDYDPTLGRYIESDPIGLAGGINTYAYVGSNPVNAIDPTGQFLWIFNDFVNSMRPSCIPPGPPPPPPPPKQLCDASHPSGYPDPNQQYFSNPSPNKMSKKQCTEPPELTEPPEPVEPQVPVTVP
jgi:RHS repeat-associated protein